MPVSGRRGRAARRIRRPGRAADDFVRRPTDGSRRSAPGQAAPWQGCCSSQNKLNLLRVVGCTVRRSAPFRQLPAWTAGRLGSADVGPLGRVAHVRVREHAGNRAVAAFVAELDEEPDPVLLDRAADADVVVPQLGAARRASSGRASFRSSRVVVADHPAGDVRRVEAALDACCRRSSARC